MTKEEIKIECESCYEQIKKNENRLKELRKVCTHEDTFEGNYSWWIGSIYPATICTHCGELIKLKIGEPIFPFIKNI